MKKLLLSLCVGLTISGSIYASVINVDGWNSYEPPVRVANDTEIDDDATGKSTANGIVITKPNADNINKNIDVVDCDNPRFSEICQQLNVNITNEVNEASKDAKSYAKYLSDRDREEMNRLIADTRDFADKRADQAQNNAENHADWIRGDLKTYADFVAEQAKNDANNHSDGLNNSLKDYVNQHDKESKEYAEKLAEIALAKANQYTDDAIANNKDDDSVTTLGQRWNYSATCLYPTNSAGNCTGMSLEIKQGSVCKRIGEMMHNHRNMYRCTQTMEYSNGSYQWL